MMKWPGNPHLEETTFGQLTRSELMARVRSKGNKTTEQRFASMLRKARISGWRRHHRLLGNPDFVWPSARLAIFLDGCFWHGHACRNTTPKTNASNWRRKISGNRFRDRKTNRRLRYRGWTVIRIWECELRAKPEKCIALVQSKLKASPSGRIDR